MTDTAKETLIIRQSTAIEYRGPYNEHYGAITIHVTRNEYVAKVPIDGPSEGDITWLPVGVYPTLIAAMDSLNDWHNRLHHRNAVTVQVNI